MQEGRYVFKLYEINASKNKKEEAREGKRGEEWIVARMSGQREKGILC